MNLLINMIPFFLNIVLFPILLITGLIVCYRHRYKGGFYFFLIILIYKLLTFVNPYIIRKLMDSREYLQTGIYPYHISVLFSIFETLVIITAFCILIVSLYVKLTSRDIVSQFVEKVKKLVMNHKKIFYILSILLLAFIALLVFNTVSKDFSLISAEVKITENPSTTIGAISQPGEEPVLPERYLQYTFTIKNKTFRALGSARNFIQLDFIPSKELFESYEEVFNDNRGYSGPGYLEGRDTSKFTLLYGISDELNIDTRLLEEQALNGHLVISLNHKIIERLKMK